MVCLYECYSAIEVTQENPVGPIDDNQGENVTVNAPSVPDTSVGSIVGNQSQNGTSGVPSAPKTPIGDVLDDDCESCKQEETPADVPLPAPKPKKPRKKHSPGKKSRRRRRGRGGSKKRPSRKHGHRRHRNSEQSVLSSQKYLFAIDFLGNKGNIEPIAEPPCEDTNVTGPTATSPIVTNGT